MIGLAAGIVLCLPGDGRAHAGAAALVAWASRFLAYGGLALIEGAAVGAAVAFTLVRFWPGPGAQPPERRDHAP